MKKGKIIALVLTAFLCTSSSTGVFAMENAENNSREIENKEETKIITIIGKENEEELKLNINEVMEKVEKDNMELKLMEGKEKLLNRLYDRDLTLSQSVDNDRDISINYNNVSFRKQQLLNFRQSALNVKSARKDREDKIKEIKRELERSYLNVLNSRRDIKNTEETLKNLDMQIEKMQRYIDAGKTSPTSIEPLKVQKTQLKSSLNFPKLQEQESLLKIKQYLGLDQSKNIKLNLEYANKEFKLYNPENIDKIINDSVEKNFGLYKMKEQLEFLKEERRIYEKYGRNTEVESTNTDIRIKDMENSIEDYKLNLRVNFWSAYYNLKSKEEAVDVAKANLQHSKMKYEETKYRFEQGLEDKVELDSKELDFEKKKIEEEKAVNEYMITVQSFKDTLEIEE
ncbi:TolC family protein [Clostridium cochlearium]|uniref:Outer membrane efflux protein n=1 Tax=Clostridium cochlearium TaxID=1494 RepID=A0A2X2Y6J0_CLOCO|nr:TolC family protein [Clostridium cochlearium]MBU5269931.1 TolC family protein [Clostridium cochlearium]SQB34120.1 Outer membrane efflux protein [Clostridium cochlearium]